MRDICFSVVSQAMPLQKPKSFLLMWKFSEQQWHRNLTSQTKPRHCHFQVFPPMFHCKHCSVKFKLHSPLLSGATKPMADVQCCHLQIACLTGKTKTLVAGCSLCHMAASVESLLKSVNDVAALTLDSNGALPSGWKCKDCLNKLIDKLLNLKANGQFKEEECTEDKNPSSTAATLTQGVAAAAAATAVQAWAKWAHKMIPIAGWVSVVLFRSKGIARKNLQNKLPLLKSVNCSEEVKIKHARVASWSTENGHPWKRKRILCCCCQSHDRRSQHHGSSSCLCSHHDGE